MNDSLPLVCVTMPVYNGALTIAKALKSLLYQSYSNWICIIVNDGSTDSTKEILDTLNDPRFRVIHLDENKGRAFARQTALDNAEGDYIAYLDADDFYHKEKLQKQVYFLIQNPHIALVGCKIASFNENDQLLTVRSVKSSQEIYFKLGDKLYFTPASTMLHYDLAKQAKYKYELKAAEDVDFFYQCLADKKYYLLEDLLYFYSEYESTSYIKILQYTLFAMKRRLLSVKQLGVVECTKQLFVCIVKFLIYAIFIPILGKRFFLNKRGIAPSEMDINIFNEQLELLKS